MGSKYSSRLIPWYRVPVEKETMRSLNGRSDWKGFLQTGGHLCLLALTATAAWFTKDRLYLLIPILFLHATFYSFLINGFHELIHNSVFKTKFLNVLFLKIYSFLAWLNPVFFWASHAEHHKYTLHQPDDLEVILPLETTLKGFLKVAFVDYKLFYFTLKGAIRLSLGKDEDGRKENHRSVLQAHPLDDEWDMYLFPRSAVEERRRMFNWARFLLVGHAAIIGVSIYFELWLLPLLITFSPFCCSWLRNLCGIPQHIGLKDDVSDFRLCCRTIILSPFVRFLYWHMNYHIEHHMYAAVPCYNLGKLHKAIDHELPYSSKGLVEAWKEIIAILKKQKVDPEYQYVPNLPDRAEVVNK